MILSLDIETNLAHDTIWCCGAVCEGFKQPTRHALSLVDGKVVELPDREVCKINFKDDADALQWLINSSDIIIGHNLIDFDIPLLEKLWNITIPKEKVVDTLLLSRLWNPRQEGGHSLGSWGVRLNDFKGDFPVEDFDKGYTDEMGDTKLTLKLYHHLLGCFDRSSFSEECIDLEHAVQWIVAEQVRNGFKLDKEKATELYQELWVRMVKAQDTLQATFPPIITKRFHKTTKKPLKDLVVEFNPGSRKQIAERLISTGVTLIEQTDKGAWKVDETVLETIDTPEAKLLLDYFLCQKRTGQIDQWLKYVDEENRVHGRVSTNGAVTGRMTHFSPNLAQVPSVTAQYGKECRECWIVDEGNVLVGIDAAGLELRMLAHYLDDEAYTTTLLEHDIHLSNMHAAGLSNRDQAKTFIYAFIYGAGVAKLGSIVGGGAGTGKKLKADFLKANPALRRLIKVNKAKYATGSILGLDGRKVRLASEHAALNTLLQSTGAIVMKKALVIFDGLLKQKSIPAKIVGNIHDEWQVEVAECFGKAVGRLGVRAIVEAGEHYKLNCPLDGSYSIGKDWSETH